MEENKIYNSDVSEEEKAETEEAPAMAETEAEEARQLQDADESAQEAPLPEADGAAEVADEGVSEEGNGSHAEEADNHADEAAADIAIPAVPAKPKRVTKEKAWQVGKFFVILLVMAFIRAVTNYVFIIPNGFAPGGIGGIATIIYNAVGRSNPQLANTVFDPGITTFVMNIPILIVAYFALNKKFVFNTFVIITSYSAFITLFGKVGFPTFLAKDAAGATDTGLQIIAALIGGAITGVCLGIMLRNNMSMAGTDIIGKIIHKHNPAAGANWWIIACDCVVAMMSGILGILDIKSMPGSPTPTAALTAVLSPILFSFLSLIVTSVVADVVQSGFQSSLVFNIITDKPEEIARKISDKLHRGVTVTKAVGFYTGIEHEVLLCVVSKKQINTVKNIISETDPMAFTYITQAREVAGKGFRSAG